MNPVVFDGCFGWLHQPPDGRCADTAVLICPGLMVDALLSHASLRVLADKLSAAGYCVLRFDYPGTADSRDLDQVAGEEHWSVWRQSVSTAADWLRQNCGVHRLILCGVRAGGTLAVLAASERNDIAGLLLFEPVTAGRSYVRQLILEADLQVGRVSDRSEGLVIREFEFAPATITEMSTIDLAKTRLPAGLKVVLCYRPEAKAVEDCAKAWSESGLAISNLGWTGLETLLRLPELEEAPCPDFAAAVDSVRRAVPPVYHGMQVREPVVRANLALPGCVEEPLQFGPGGRLFGILCRPATNLSPERVVIIANSGRDPHYGGSRHNVSVARRLARTGIASLRIDFSGLGDSPGPPGREEFMSNIILTDRREDFRAAVQLLTEMGFRRIAAQGLCTGAYHVFCGALDDPRVEALAMVNIVFFSLPSIDAQIYLDQRWYAAEAIVRKLLRWRSWMTLLGGRSDLRRSLRGVLANVRIRLVAQATALARRLGHAKEEAFATSAMAALSERGVRTFFVFSPGTVEIESFAREFGPNGEGLAPFAGAVMRVVPGMDHNLSIRQGRERAEAMIIDFFKGAIPGQPEASVGGH